MVQPLVLSNILFINVYFYWHTTQIAQYPTYNNTLTHNSPGVTFPSNVTTNGSNPWQPYQQQFPPNNLNTPTPQQPTLQPNPTTINPTTSIPNIPHALPHTTSNAQQLMTPYYSTNMAQLQNNSGKKLI